MSLHKWYLKLKKNYRKNKEKRLKEIKERNEKEPIILTQKELSILKSHGWIIQNPNTHPVMVATEEYAIQQGIPKNDWNCTAIRLNGWKIPFIVVNTIHYIIPSNKR